jgi:RimJ/RimL family protein N-acetyltransferase
LQLFRVELVMAMTNLASRRVADKAGAQFEGLARHRLYLNGSSVDAAIYSLIPGEVRIASCLTYT